MTVFIHTSVITRRLLLLSWCVVLLLTRSQVLSASTCAEEEKACKTRCGSSSEYDFDCDDSQDGARAYSCACRSTGEWSEVASFPSGFETPLTFDSFPDPAGRNTGINTNTVSEDAPDYCTRERSLCAALCVNGTEPDFDCKDDTSKDGASSSQASACACKTSNSSSKTSIDTNITVIPTDIPRNGTCETSRLSCIKSCPEGSKADFTCESSSTKDGTAFRAFSGSCTCFPLDVTQDGPLSGSIQANNEVPTDDARFASGAKYAIQYMMASLLMLQAAMGIDNDAE